MHRESRLQATAVTAITISVVVILMAAFTWPEPGGVGFHSGAPILYDQALVEEVYDRVSPAVVEIYVDRRSGDSFVQIGAGSGFLINDQGHIATNDHVIGDADRIRVSFLNGINTEATVLGRNPANDLVLIKVDPEVVAGIQPVELGDSARVRPGQLAIVIGSPFGLAGSVSVGVSSGVNRALPSDLAGFIPGMIQTDALIGPGNSGGPILNRKGEVVGITTAIQLSSAQHTQRSVGFGVPSNTLKELLPRLGAGGTPAN